MAAAERNSSVVFFGSPDFAVPSLKTLTESEYRPRLVVTQPDRPAGRGKKLVPTPIGAWARDAGLRVEVCGSLKDLAIRPLLERLEPDFFVVVAFGLIFPDPMLRIASKANVNLHASLLPAYRGASPINMAIVRGERTTGVTTMEMASELDAGPIYLQDRVEIDPDENAGELSARLAEIGAPLLLETLRGISRGEITPAEQPGEGISYASRLKKRDGLIPWELDSKGVHDHIRGMNPWPGSHTYNKGDYLKVHRAEACDRVDHSQRPGEVIEVTEKGIVVSCGTGAVRLTRLQAPGKRALDACEFVRGYDVRVGAVLTSEVRE